jgi:hypothetical protein
MCNKNDVRIDVSTWVILSLETKKASKKRYWVRPSFLEKQIIRDKFQKHF